MPARIQRMMLFLANYPSMKLPGPKLKIPDALSRASAVKVNAIPECQDIEYQVHSLEKHIPASDEVMEDFRKYSKQDASLETIKGYLLNGWPDSMAVETRTLLILI